MTVILLGICGANCGPPAAAEIAHSPGIPRTQFFFDLINGGWILNKQIVLFAFGQNRWNLHTLLPKSVLDFVGCFVSTSAFSRSMYKFTSEMS